MTKADMDEWLTEEMRVFSSDERKKKFHKFYKEFNTRENRYIFLTFDERSKIKIENKAVHCKYPQLSYVPKSKDEFNIDNRAINVFWRRYVYEGCEKFTMKNGKVFNDDGQVEEFLTAALEMFGENHLVHNFSNKEMVEKIYEFGEEVYGDGIEMLESFYSMMEEWEREVKNSDFDYDHLSEIDWYESQISVNSYYEVGSFEVYDEFKYSDVKKTFVFRPKFAYELGLPSEIDAQVELTPEIVNPKYFEKGYRGTVKNYLEYEGIMVEHLRKIGMSCNHEVDSCNSVGFTFEERRDILNIIEQFRKDKGLTF